MRRLRPLSEAECYARLYGGNEEPTVTILRSGPSAQSSSPTGEALGGQVEPEPDAREAESADWEAA